jgi:peptidoglycan/LPS O-acetylase OafA/YrhL
MPQQNELEVTESESMSAGRQAAVLPSGAPSNGHAVDTTAPSAPAADKVARPLNASAALKHRNDIDGLRAVAVISVLLFHARIFHMLGGFVGVDIFFVISGFLITTLILQDIHKDRFSILSFYERRGRRLLPALLLVLFLTTLAANQFLLPYDARDYGRQLLATLFFSSNLLFARQTGYFDAPAEMKPLLHTWSLAVEEQFYILYPLFLYLVTRFFRRRYALAISLVAAGSLALSVHNMSSHSAGNFYLPFGRAWELLIGGLLAVKILPELRSKIWANLLGLLGLALIGYSVFAFSPATPFPGFNALYPCVGAALIIYSGSVDTLVARALSLKPVVFIGLISYSLYLWHWVIIVFTKYALVRPLTSLETAGVVVSSIVLAAISWKYVELPFRGKNALGTRPVFFSAAALASLLLCVYGGLVFKTHGLPSRFSGEARLLVEGSEDTWKRADECNGQICHVGPNGGRDEFILWGDSHAGALAPAIEQIAQDQNLSGWVAYKGACAPLLGLQRYDQDVDCRGFNDSVLDHIKSHHIKNVFLHGRWGLYTEAVRYKQELGGPALLTPDLRKDENYAEFAQLVDSTLNQLHALDLNVVIIASVPEVGVNVPTALTRAYMSGKPLEVAPRVADFNQRQSRAFQVLRESAAKYSIPIVYPDKLLCNASDCLVEKDDRPFYSDDNHLSVHGAMYLAPAVEKWLSAVKAEAN